MAYMTPAQLVAASTVDALTSATADEHQRWWTAAKRAIERFCGQTFEEVPATRVLDGNDGKRLPLDKRLATLVELSVSAPGFPTSLAVTDVALTEDHDALYVLPDALTGGTWATRALREGRPAVFPAGFGTVSIGGTWGWLDTELPPDLTNPVNVAMLAEMEDQALVKTHGLAESIRAAARMGLRNTADGRVNAELEVPDIVLSVESQSALDDLIWHPVGFGA